MQGDYVLAGSYCIVAETRAALGVGKRFTKVYCAQYTDVSTTTQSYKRVRWNALTTIEPARVQRTKT